MRTFARLAQAEARVHGVEPDAVHFHEVGALDSIADIVGVAAGLHDLGIDSLSCSRIAVGSGQVRTAHGTMPVPVPAVVELAAGWRVYAGGSGELTTPTGMALIAALAETSEELPTLDLRRAGCGAGSRDTPDRPNVTRVLVGGRPAPAANTANALEAAVLIETNIDDLDPRLWPGVLTSLLEAGAADAWLAPILMKKGRPAHTLSVLAHPARVATLRDLVLSRTPTFGVRETPVARTVLGRGWVDVSVAGIDLPVKIAHRAGVVWQATPEFEELDRAAAELGRSPQALLTEALVGRPRGGAGGGRSGPRGAACWARGFRINPGLTPTRPPWGMADPARYLPGPADPGIFAHVRTRIRTSLADRGLSAREELDDRAHVRRSSCPTGAARVDVDPDRTRRAAARGGHPGSGHGAAGRPGEHPGAGRQRSTGSCPH